MSDYRKYLLISGETSRLINEEWSLDRFAWKEAYQIKNLSDYDAVVLNLEALAFQRERESLHPDITAMVFSAASWRQILRGGGRIILVGDLECVVPGRPEMPQNLQAEHLGKLIDSRKDRRPLEYRRIRRSDEDSEKRIYAYMDQVTDWSYSLSHLDLTQAFAALLQKGQSLFDCHVVFHGVTSFSTALAVTIGIICDHGPSMITLLPSSGRGYEADDIFVLREWLDVYSTVPPPKWVDSLTLPMQPELEKRIEAKTKEWEALRLDIETDQSALEDHKRWYRLLFDDGFGLEEIVKEAFGALGATVEKMSKEKDDYRLTVQGYPTALMEVKGTHNAKFPIGVLRQLSGWIDEAESAAGISFKGIFVGNADRNEPPAVRGPLFESNGESFARIKQFTVLRTTDLYCLRMLAELQLLDNQKLWSELFGCSGSFNASAYWKQLPEQYLINGKGPSEA